MPYLARPARTLCFMFWLPRPPRSPLFPYTTLFRSVSDGVLASCWGCASGAPTPASPDAVTALDRPGQRGLRHSTAPNLAGMTAGDRKSTRLNSSHSQISYAVFCLKQKRKLLRIHALSRTPSPHSVFYVLATATTAISTLSLHDALPICFRRRLGQLLGLCFRRSHPCQP